MKLEDSKHNHKLTNLLKVCLFGFIMILPFFAMLPSTLYFAFNEHAQNYTYQSVTETYEYETNEVNSVDDLVVGNIYNLEYAFEDLQYNIAIYSTGFYNIQFKNDNTTDFALIEIDLYHLEDQQYFIRYQNDNVLAFQLYDSNFTWVSNISTTTKSLYTSVKMNFIYTTNITASFGAWIPFISASDYLGEKTVTITESEQSPLNAFNTASSNIWNMPIFNWVTTGIGATALSNFIRVFGITQNTFISNILIYWLTITTIYIVIDVVLTLFIELTHIITKKAS